MKAWVKLLLLVALAGAGALLLTPSNGPDPAQVGKVAPPLVLPDLAGGREVSLASLRGKAVALNFWATWCQPCKEEMPGLVEAWRAAPRGCVEFLGVTEESSRQEAAAEVARFGVPYPVVIDADGSAARAYGVTGLPRTYVVDAQGVIRRVFSGRVSREALEKALAPHLPPPCRSAG